MRNIKNLYSSTDFKATAANLKNRKNNFMNITLKALGICIFACSSITNFALTEEDANILNQKLDTFHTNLPKIYPSCKPYLVQMEKEQEQSSNTLYEIIEAIKNAPAPLDIETAKYFAEKINTIKDELKKNNQQYNIFLLNILAQKHNNDKTLSTNERNIILDNLLQQIMTN